jgi:hypothetical protein
MNEDDVRERQRTWSTWLDEHCGPGTVPLHLEDAEDREELAAMLAGVVEFLFADRPHTHTPRGERERWWWHWLRENVVALELELGKDREVLARMLAEALPSAPETSQWGGWREFEK